MRVEVSLTHASPVPRTLDLRLCRILVSPLRRIRDSAATTQHSRPPRNLASPNPLPSMAAASTSVLASGGTSPATGDPFPTTGRAFALIGGQALCGFGILILLLAATPTGHHAAHVGNSSVGFLGILCVLVGASFFTVATSRVQRDVMGGGWNSRISLRYISPQITWYVISPAGISAAANRLNIAPALAMLAVYGLLACDVLIMAARYLGH